MEGLSGNEVMARVIGTVDSILTKNEFVFRENRSRKSYVRDLEAVFYNYYEDTLADEDEDEGDGESLDEEESYESTGDEHSSVEIELGSDDTDD